MHLFDLAKQWAFAHPRRPNGSSWNQWCQALMANFNGFSHSYMSAAIAYRASDIVSLDATKAPVGAFHFWGGLGAFGHVGQDLTGGGRTVFMATHNLTTFWGSDIGTISAHAYTVKTGARYLGWARNCGNQAPRTASDIGVTYKPGPKPAPSPSGKSWEFKQPAAAVRKDIQDSLRARKRFTGKVDGSWESDTIKAIQVTITNVGYSGIIDGEAGPQTCYYVQVYAKTFGGYDGPLDKKLAAASWAGFQKGVKA